MIDMILLIGSRNNPCFFQHYNDNRHIIESILISFPSIKISKRRGEIRGYGNIVDMLLPNQGPL